jgi:hypothetical protein
MARGKSGRIVLEIDPILKKNLYLALEKNEKTLREWFVSEVEKFIFSQQQPELFENLFKKKVNTG